MLINKKPSKPSIVSKSKDLANTKKCGQLTKSIINLESEHHHALQQTNKINRIISLKQSFERNISQNNRSQGKQSKDFKKVSIRNKKMTESKNSKGSKSSHKSFIKTNKDKDKDRDSKLVKQLEKLIDLVRRSSVEQIPSKLQEKFFEYEMDAEESDKLTVSKVAILTKIIMHKMMGREKSVDNREDSYLKKQSKESECWRDKEKEGEKFKEKKEYENFMDFEFSANDLMKSEKDVEMSQCSYNSYIAQPNQGECVGYKRLKEDVQNKLKLDLNKLKLNK